MVIVAAVFSPVETFVIAAFVSVAALVTFFTVVIAVFVFVMVFAPVVTVVIAVIG